MAQPPQDMEALWPKERGILKGGQIVRLEDGRLAEWYPLPESWPHNSLSESATSAPLDLSLDHYAALKWSSAPEEGWILWSKPDAPSLAEAMRDAKKPRQKAAILRGLSRLASLDLESPGAGRILLEAETIFAPFGWTSDLSSPFKALALPSNLFPVPSEAERIRHWVALLGKLGAEFWGEEGVRFQAIAHKLANKDAETEIGVSADLRQWADRLEETSSKGERRDRNFVLLAAALFCLFVSTIWGLANWRNAALRIKDLENQRRQDTLLREEQIKLLGFSARTLADGLPGNAINDGPLAHWPQLGPLESMRWRSWMRLAATFDKGDDAHPELLALRALGHELLSEPAEGGLLWTRLAATKGPWAARACLHMASRTKDKSNEAKEWLDRAAAALEDWPNTTERELLYAAIDLAKARDKLRLTSPEEAEPLFTQAYVALWTIVEDKRVIGERSPMRAKALALYSATLPESEPALGKIGNVIDETIADFPVYYPLVREKIRLQAKLRQAAMSRPEARNAAERLRRAIADSWRRYPERKEYRLEEIGSMLDAALLAPRVRQESDGPNEAKEARFESLGLEIWAQALAKLEEAADDKPKDPAVLRTKARVWTAGALIADQAPGQLAMTIDSYLKALAVWDLVVRLEGPSMEIALVMARLQQEIAWAAERQGDAVMAQEYRKQARDTASRVLKEFPGSVDALEIMARIEETIAWDAMVNQSLNRARAALAAIDRHVLQFRQGNDELDKERFQWILMRRAQLDILIELSGNAKPDKKKVDRLLGELRSTLQASKTSAPSKTIEFSEEMDRLRARLAALEALQLQKEKASKEKVETQVSKARVAQNKALLSDWETRHFDALWLGIR